MKIILVIIFSAASLSATSQHFFEGIVNFNVDVEVRGDSILKQNLENFYGKNLSMHYWKDGSFRIHYNVGEGVRHSNYSPTTGNLTYHTKSTGGKGVSPMGKLHLLSKRKVANVDVLGKSCDCFEFKAEDVDEIIHTITYCFSKETPTINYRSFKLCKDFLFQDYFETAERPFLKHVHESKYQKVSWLANSIEVKQLDQP